jgi:hypothetical protein
MGISSTARQKPTVLWSSLLTTITHIKKYDILVGYSKPNRQMFLDEPQIYDMIFETAKYEHSLPAKSFFRKPFPGGGFQWRFTIQIATKGSEQRVVESLSYKARPYRKARRSL